MKQKLNHFKVKISDNKAKIIYRENHDNKLKIKRITKISSESNNKNTFLIPSTNIKKKNNYNFNSLKGDLEYSRQNRYYKKINYGDNINYSSLQNNLREGDKMIEKPKIKIKKNTNKNSKVNVVSSYMHKREINSNLDKINKFDKNDKALIFNNSCLDNITKPYKRNKRNINTLNLIQNSLDSTDKNIKNKNMSYIDNCNESYDKKMRILTNTIENLINIRNNIKNEYYSKENAKILNTNENFMNNKVINRYNDKNYLYENKKYKKNELKKNNNRYEIFNLLNLKLNNIDNTISSLEEYNQMAPVSLTQKNVNHSNSMKEFDNDISIFHKSIRRNNNNYSSLYSSPNYLLQTTYHRKLVKNHSIKMSDNETINKPSKLENLITREDCKNNNCFNYINNANNSFHNYKYNSFKTLSKSNSFKISRIPDNRLAEIEKIHNNKINSNFYSIDNKYCHRYSNINLTTNYNKEKDETKYTSEQVSDNNYSTTTSFYYNKNNNSLLNNHKRVPSNNSELHLKNIITSIDYRKSNPNMNNSNNRFKNNNNNKNIVLYELDKFGKLNYKVREMTNSMEKIIRDASNSRNKKRLIKLSPKIEQEHFTSIYVKKNQGTVLRKNIDNKKNKYYSISSISNIKNKKKK